MSGTGGSSANTKKSEQQILRYLSSSETSSAHWFQSCSNISGSATQISQCWQKTHQFLTWSTYPNIFMILQILFTKIEKYQLRAAATLPGRHQHNVGNLLYASMRVMFYFVLHHSRHFSVTLRHHCLTILLTICYRYFSSLRLPSFVPFFVTDLFHPYYVPSIIPWFCGQTILP